MSITTNRPIADGTTIDIPSDPTHVFRELFETSPFVCKRCFYRVKTKVRVPPSAGYNHHDIDSSMRREDPPPNARFELLEAEYWSDSNIRTRYLRDFAERSNGDVPMRGRKYCRNCGYFDTHTGHEQTLSKTEMVDLAANISQTLSEYGVGHDWLVLMGSVKDLKSKPDLAGRDYDVFRKAVTRSIRAHDTHPSNGAT